MNCHFNGQFGPLIYGFSVNDTQSHWKREWRHFDSHCEPQLVLTIVAQCVATMSRRQPGKGLRLINKLSH